MRYYSVLLVLVLFANQNVEANIYSSNALRNNIGEKCESESKIRGRVDSQLLNSCFDDQIDGTIRIGTISTRYNKKTWHKQISIFCHQIWIIEGLPDYAMIAQCLEDESEVSLDIDYFIETNPIANSFTETCNLESEGQSRTITKSCLQNNLTQTSTPAKKENIKPLHIIQTSSDKNVALYSDGTWRYISNNSKSKLIKESTPEIKTSGSIEISLKSYKIGQKSINASFFLQNISKTTEIRMAFTFVQATNSDGEVGDYRRMNEAETKIVSNCYGYVAPRGVFLCKIEHQFEHDIDIVTYRIDLSSLNDNVGQALYFKTKNRSLNNNF